MKGVNDWIRKRPIEAFFLVAILACFATLLPAILIIPQEGTIAQLLSFYLASIGVYSPVFAAMFVARVIHPEGQHVSLSRRMSVFLPIWLIAAVIRSASLGLTAAPGTSRIALFVLCLPVALLPAFVLSSAFYGSVGIKQVLETLVRPKGNIAYYFVALLTFPIAHILGNGITNTLKGGTWFSQVRQVPEFAFAVLVTFFSVLLFSGGINEESGWRGFAQNRLQGHYNPLVANLILWFLMVLWHIPNDIVQYQHGGYLMVRIATYPFITILFGWTYNRTKGSLLAPAIFHASMNSMNPLMGVLPITAAGNILLVGFAIVAVVLDRMWRRLPGDHPAIYQDAVDRTSATSSA